MRPPLYQPALTPRYGLVGEGSSAARGDDGVGTAEEAAAAGRDPCMNDLLPLTILLMCVRVWVAHAGHGGVMRHVIHLLNQAQSSGRYSQG